MSADWMVSPGDHCGKTRSVCWIVKDTGTAHWNVWCQSCGQFGHSERETNRFTHDRLGDSAVGLLASLDADGDVLIWQRPGLRLSQAEARDLVHALNHLGRLPGQRAIEDARPGKWRLELGPDGRLWAPWGPGRTKQGAPVPFREGTLRETKRKRKRKCSLCERALGAGDVVFRPDADYVATMDCRGRWGWSPTVVSSVLVCMPCGDRAGRGFSGGPILRVLSGGAS